MPKRPQRNKDFQHTTSGRSRSGVGKVIAVRELLAKAGITTKAIAQHSVKQRGWRDFLGEALPAPLASHISAVSTLRGTLTVLADSPGWSVRLRYALEEQLPAIRDRDASVLRIVVKVAGR